MSIATNNIAFNVDEIRKDFPILNREVNGYPLVYFDNAATSQADLPTINSNRRGVNLGLGLPDDASAQPVPSPQPQTRITSPSQMYPEQMDPQ